MTATDELRRLLDERGVEWREGLGNEHRVETFFDDMNGHTALFVDFGDGNPFGSESELSADLTPEQAVEATLGSDLQAENAKLREERDMYRDLVGCMVHPDVPDQLAAENAKLRQLVLDYEELAAALCNARECDGCPFDSERTICEHMRLIARVGEQGVDA